MTQAKRSARLKIGSTLVKRRYSDNPAAMRPTQDLPAGTVYKLIETTNTIEGTIYTLILASGKDTIRHTINASWLDAFNLTKPYTNVPRYGMAWHTIRYHQTQARDLYRFNGIYAGRHVLESSTAKLATMSPRDIGHAAIQLATYAGPEHIRAVLTRTRGARWKY